MNNFLPLLLIMAMSKGNGFSLDTLMPLVKSLGIDEGAISSLLSGSLFKGNEEGSDGKGFSIEKLLPLAMNLLSSSTSNSPKAQDNPAFSQNKSAVAEDSTTPNYLKPICNIADERINYALAHYFANN